MTYERIVNGFAKYVRDCHGIYSDWYVGITNDVERRMFGEHGVDRAVDAWIYDTAHNSVVARQVEQYFINSGMKGGSGGGDNTANVVYAYQMNNRTKP